MCGSINVETSDTEFGPVNAGPFTINTCGDTLRLWSAGGISASVTPGSALIEVEPNIIFIGDGEPVDFSPGDPTRPAFFMNSSNGDTYMWNPDDPNGTVEHWAMNSVYPIHVNVDGPTGIPPSGSNPHFSPIKETSKFWAFWKSISGCDSLFTFVSEWNILFLTIFFHEHIFSHILFYMLFCMQNLSANT